MKGPDDMHADHGRRILYQTVPAHEDLQFCLPSDETRLAVARKSRGRNGGRSRCRIR